MHAFLQFFRSYTALHKTVTWNEIPMEALYNTFEVTTHKQFETTCSNIRKRKRTETKKPYPMRKKYQNSERSLILKSGEVMEY